MQDILQKFVLMQIQKHPFCCHLLRSLIDEYGVKQVS